MIKIHELKGVVLASMIYTNGVLMADTAIFTLDSSNSAIGTINLSQPTLDLVRMPPTTGTNSYDYVTQFFTPSSSGVYSFGQTSGDVDTVMILYQGAFDPANPSLNYLNFNDDSLNEDVCGTLVGRCPVLSQELTAEVDYHLVISTWSPEASLTLPMDFFITGEGAISIGGVGSLSGFVPVSDDVRYDMARTLDNPDTSVSSELLSKISEMAALPADQRALALIRVAPLTSNALIMGTTNTVNGGLDMVSGRLQVLREQGFKSLPIPPPSRSLSYRTTSGTPTKQWASWIKSFAGSGQQLSLNNYSGYQDRYSGIAIGVDSPTSRDWVMGMGLASHHTDIEMEHLRDGDQLSIANRQLSLYSTGRLVGGYLEAMYSYSLLGYKSVRDTTVNGVATADFVGYQHAMRLNAGALWRLAGNLALTPTLGIAANRITIQPYQESGAGTLSLQVDGATYNRLATLIGGKLVMENRLSGNWVIRPSLHATWQHEINHKGMDTRATFAGGGEAFTTPGQPLSRDSVSYGAAVSMFVNPQQQLTVMLDGFRGDHYSAFSGQLQWQSFF